MGEKHVELKQFVGHPVSQRIVLEFWGATVNSKTIEIETVKHWKWKVQEEPVQF